MTDPDVLVVGAGPAGLAAVVELARLGLSSLLVEQRDQVGGAIFRGCAGTERPQLVMPEHLRARRDTLKQAFAQAQAQGQVTQALQSVFIGADRDGRFLIDDRCLGRVRSVTPKAVILAVGAVERVQPCEGWELPGVVSAGGMQLQLKETGQAPAGLTLLAGSGPLLLALAAQLAALGRPPLAVLERAQPLASIWVQGRAVADALRSWAHVQEVALYARELWRARVPYRTGWRVAAVQAIDHGLRVQAQHSSGVLRDYVVQHVALHDGLVPNATGLPLAAVSSQGCVVHAGDGREILGASAAIDDGCRAARQVGRYLGQHCASARLDDALATARRTQHALTQLFSTPHGIVPTANTVVCRCEGLRRADFDRLQVAGSAHELRLVGRFGMGACQGRFCAHTASALAHDRGIDFDPAALHGDVPRWPLRPVALTALAGYAEPEPVL